MDDSEPRGPRASEPSPALARRRLGQELRAVRERVQLSLDQAAAGIQRSPATLSRLENGRSTPRLVDVKALLDDYAQRDPGAVPDGLRARILDLANIGRTLEWFASYRDVISSDMTNDDIRRFIEFETDAAVIRCYEPDLVPGLLQTRGYMAALTRLAFPTRSALRQGRLVDFRMARQQVLRRNGGHVVMLAVIGEAALRRRIAPPEVMREQLRSLLDALDDDHSGVVVRVAPITLGVRAVIGGSLLVMEFDDPDEIGLVYLEGRASGQYLQSPADLAQHRGQFDELVAHSLDRAGSRAVIADLVRD